ncbi:hypothetical protein B0H19DRAFT_1259297 [Mycena capillaripes]|nr:hypothetical protein B0H19DRAFT_1259297 [Mycena capillaripes]
MDSNGDGHTDDEFSSDSSPDDPASSESSDCGSGMFSSAHHFNLTARSLTNNITNNYNNTPAVPLDFRMIPLGDIDLQSEHDTGGVVYRQNERCSVRRVYSAKIDGRASEMTVAVYQGNGAEEEWRQHIAKYMSVRHPNIIQISGAATSHNIYAMLFHGDLIPFRHFLELYRHSPTFTVYIHAYCTTEFRKINEYFDSTFTHDLYLPDCTLWIRQSTGQLCMDLVPYFHSTYFPGNFSSSQTIKPLTPLTQETMVIDSLALDHYHFICTVHLSQPQHFSPSTPITLNPGAIMFCPSRDQLEDAVEIALLVDPDIHLQRPITDAPEGFLFVCPIKDFQSGPTSFRWPECPAYWSLDPSGIERLSTDEATHLGFPSIQFKTWVEGYFWDASVYAGLRQFHQGKGFDPDSQEIARHLGHPLYRLPGEVDASFAHGVGEDSSAEDNQSCATAEDESDSENELEKSGENHVDDEHPSAENDENAGGTKNEHGDLKKSVENQVHDLLSSEKRPEDSDLYQKIPLSWTFQLFMDVQLALIVFLALSWLYDQV